MVNSRGKGKRGELEFAKLVNKVFGFTKEEGVRRTPLSGGMGFKGDLIQLKGELEKYHWEVKNQKNVYLWTWMEQAERDCPLDKIPVLAIKKPNDGKFYILMNAEEVLGMIKCRQQDT
jgi:hypothetical protein